MAASVTANLTLLTNNDNDSNWSGTDGPDAYNNHIQGTNSESWLISKNSSETGTWDDGTTYDMSAANTHFYIWMKTDLTNYYTDVRIRLISTTGNYREYIVANQTTKLWNGAWKCFVLDLSGGTETGTFNSASVATIDVIVDNSASGNIRSVTNFWIDVMRYGTGLTATGTDFNIKDVADINSSETNAYGILEEIDGIIFAQGKLNIGNGATTTTFTSDNEVVVFKDLEVSNDLYEIKVSGSGCTAEFNSATLRASGDLDNTRFTLNMGDNDSDLTISGTSITKAGLSDFASTGDIQNSVFNNCWQIDPSASIFQNNTISNSIDPSAALLWPDNSNTKDLTFIDNSTGIELKSDVTPKSFDNILFQDSSTTGRYDVINTSGSAVTVNLTNGSNANSYDAGGSTVTFASSVLLSMLVKDEDGDAIQGAYAYIDDDNETPFIMNTSTNVSGSASVTHTGGPVTGATWRVRKYGYKPYRAITDIGAINKELPVTLVVDPQQS